ncbi:hypothetical protein, partial [Escherichia coli]|uniref:hypothetical protein n=2 Tax=Escherichia coli TaxID=562 RepID=UPI000B3EA8B6
FSLQGAGVTDGIGFTLTNRQMNRKYYFNNMWWGWVTGGYMLYMSWDYDFKYRLLFWCISLCGMVLYPVARWCIENTAL